MTAAGRDAEAHDRDVEVDDRDVGASGPEDPSARARFLSLYGGPPSRLARAPGRVNLIGEHIDYCGLAVLPMAIDRHVSLLFRPRPDATVRIATQASGLGREDPGPAPREFALGTEIPPYASGDWGNYPKAAARAVARGYGPGGDGSGLVGIDGLVLSDLPAASGLSSSSALVVACALALLDANGRSVGGDVDPRELARRLAAGERYVGTEGGGMDQAACLLAEAGHALRIAFDPLRTATVPVPPGWRFMVAHSLERAEKSGSARETYNRRRRETEEALGRLRGAGGRDVTTVSRAGTAAGGGTADAEPITAPTTYPRLLATLGASALLARSADLPAPLDRRFRHVVTEAARVDEAEHALRDEDLEPFGAVLLDGHCSLRDDFEVSTPALDRLVEIAVACGAAGARLTGAGLGGCVVAVCEAGREGALMAGLEQDFYRDRAVDGPLDDQLFLVRPAAGGHVETGDAPSP